MFLFRGLKGFVDAFLDSELEELQKTVRTTAKKAEAEASHFRAALDSAERDLRMACREHLEHHVRQRLSQVRLIANMRIDPQDEPARLRKICRQTAQVEGQCRPIEIRQLAIHAARLLAVARNDLEIAPQ